MAILVAAAIVDSFAASEPDSRPDILWAPARVGEGRRFRIIVRSGSALRCGHPDGIALLDSSRSGAEHRYYFRAQAAAGRAEIEFVSARSRPATAQIRVISEAEWDTEAMLGQIALPRVWPLDRRPVGPKSRHTISQADRIGANPDATRPDEAGWSDEELWQLYPRCDLPRGHFMNLSLGCPTHGLAIYHENPYYPWIVDPRTEPHRVQCPVGDEWLPTNDLTGDDFTGGAFADDGFGYEPGSLNDAGVPDKYGIVAYALLRRVRYAYGAVSKLSSHYEATGDPATAHKLAVLLAGIAREHRYLCYFPEHRFGRYMGSVVEEVYRERSYRGTIQYGPYDTDSVAHLGSSGMGDYSVNTPKQYRKLLRAYDLIFDRIEGDAELLAFVSDRMPWLTDGRSIHEFMEKYLLRAAAQAVLDDAAESNLPRPQELLLMVIRALDTPEAAELARWLVHGGGQVASMPVNHYYKDGASYESVGGYNGIHVTGLIPLARGLRDLCRSNPGSYPSDRFDVLAGSERFAHILRWPMEIVVAQTALPLIGDIGEVPTAKALDPTPEMGVGGNAYRYAAETWPDDETFRAVAEMQAAIADRRRLLRASPGSTLPPVPADPRLFWPSRLLDGYGVAVLESGDGADRRGVWLYYGDHPFHSHDQRLDIGLVAHKRNLLRHMGYPYSWQHLDTWDANWVTHYGVKIVTDSVFRVRSTARLFHGDGPFQIVEAVGYGISGRRSDDGYLERPGNRIRRALCMVDLPDGRWYVVDMFRAEGGSEHWWTFHGPPGSMTNSAEARLREQATGTVAGPDVPYGEKPASSTPRSLANLYDVRRCTTDAGPVSATWTVREAGGLQLRATQVAPAGGEVVFARGRSPHAPAENPPYELDWMLRHVSGRTPLDTEFTTVIEADTSLPLSDVRAVRAGDVTGVRVETSDVVHWILRSPGMSPRPLLADTVAIGNVRFAGRAAFVEIDRADRSLRAMTLVGEGLLTWRGVGIVRGARDWRGSIVGIDRSRKALSIRAEDPPPDDLVGRYVMVSRRFEHRPDGDCFAYRVESVESTGPGLWRCRVNWSPQIGSGVVSRHTDRGFAIASRLPLGRSRTYYRGAYLHGAGRDEPVRLYDAGQEHGDESLIVLEPSARSTVGEAFPIGSSFAVDEIGVGDEITVPGTTRLARTNGQWQLVASGDAHVNVLPAPEQR